MTAQEYDISRFCVCYDIQNFSLPAFKRLLLVLKASLVLPPAVLLLVAVVACQVPRAIPRLLRSTCQIDGVPSSTIHFSEFGKIKDCSWIFNHLSSYQHLPAEAEHSMCGFFRPFWHELELREANLCQRTSIGGCHLVTEEGKCIPCVRNGNYISQLF